MADHLILYDNLVSTNALKVRFLLAELDLVAERVPVPLGDARPAWYQELHPFATVPCLVDGDLVLVESNAILRYLADREGRDDLYPREPRRRAVVDDLLDALSLAVRPPLWDVELATIYARVSPAEGGGSAADGDPGTYGPLLAPLEQALDGYERLLAASGHAAGPFGIADCAIAGRLKTLASLPLERTRWPRLGRVLDAAQARPAYRAALAGS
jgi:glutathione S-transferase